MLGEVVVVLGLVEDEPELESGLARRRRGSAVAGSAGCEVSTVGSLWVWLRPGSVGFVVVVGRVLVLDTVLSAAALGFVFRFWVVAVVFAGVFAAAAFAPGWPAAWRPSSPSRPPRDRDGGCGRPAA